MNKEPENKKINTLRELAYKAIAKQYKKICRYEAKVIKDKDPENLHQMRVAMRTLRSIITSFTPILVLPSTITQKKIGGFARILGELRDMDVLMATLINDYLPVVSETEQEYLQQGLEVLGKKRKKAYKKTKTVLESKPYRSFKQDMENWLQEPKFKTIADLAVVNVSPDLLLPELSSLFIHPGWLVATKIREGESHLIENLTSDEVEEIFNNCNSCLHSLRKAAKRCRYNLEIFTDFYGDEYIKLISQVKQIQSIIGKIQDGYVLSDFLRKYYPLSAQAQISDFLTEFKKERYEQWLAWRKIQATFLNQSWKMRMRLVVQIPNQLVTCLPQIQSLNLSNIS